MAEALAAVWESTRVIVWSLIPIPAPMRVPGSKAARLVGRQRWDSQSKLARLAKLLSS